MKADKFIGELISRTNSGKGASWEKTGDQFDSYQSYKLSGGNDTEVVLRMFDISHYESDGNVYTSPQCIMEIHDESGKDLGYIYEDDLDDPSNLFRLYRAAERNVNKVDERIEGFFDE